MSLELMFVCQQREKATENKILQWVQLYDSAMCVKD